MALAVALSTAGAAPAGVAGASTSSSESGSASYEVKRDIIAPLVGTVAFGGMIGAVALWAMQTGVLPMPTWVGPGPSPLPGLFKESPAQQGFGSCDEARRAGFTTPLHRGQPGYALALDRDGDGVACEG